MRSLEEIIAMNLKAEAKEASSVRLMTAQEYRIQSMIDKGTLTFCGPDRLVYHTNGQAYMVGSTSDIPAMVNVIVAIDSAVRQ